MNKFDPNIVNIFCKVEHYEEVHAKLATLGFDIKRETGNSDTGSETGSEKYRRFLDDGLTIFQKFNLAKAAGNKVTPRKLGNSSSSEEDEEHKESI